MAQLTMKEKANVYERLKPLLKEAEGNTWKYVEGFTDKRAAEVIGVTRMQLVGVRTVFFGALHKEKSDIPYVRIPDIVKRLMVVEDELARLKSELGA
jgi:hypothetical protein